MDLAAAASPEQATPGFANTITMYDNTMYRSDLNKDSTAELIEEEDDDDQLQQPERDGRR